MLPQQKMVGHARDVIADHAVQRLPLGLLHVLHGHSFWLEQVVLEKSLERFHGTLAFLDDRGIVVQPPVQKFLQRRVKLRRGGAQPRQAHLETSNVFHVTRAAG